MTRPVLVAIAAALGLLLAGCTSAPVPVPSAAALVGTWRDDANGSLVLTDGGCTARRVAVSGYLATGDCTWRVGAATGPRSADGHPLVQVSFPKDSAATVNGFLLEVDGTGPDLVLFREVDPDRGARYVLRRS